MSYSASASDPDPETGRRMRRIAAVVGVIALLALIVAGVWFVAATPGPAGDAPAADVAAPRVTTVGAPKPAREGGRTRAATGEPASGESEEPDAEPNAAEPPVHATSGTISICVVHADGSPAAGAEVSVRASRPDDEDSGARKPPRATTDAHGRARVDAGHDVAAVHATWQGREAAVLRHPDRVSENLLTLLPAVVVRGRVVTTEGDPVAGAACKLNWPTMTGKWVSHEWTATTDATGAFDFPLLPRIDGEESAELDVRAAGRADRRVGFSEDEPPPELVVVTMRAELVVRGRCVDEAGAPVAGVRVRKDWRDSRTTLDDGTFELVGIDPTEDTVVVEPKDRTPVAFEDLPDDRATLDLGDVVLRKGLSISGVFLDETGAPVAAASIVVRPTGDWNWSRSATTDAEGRFTVAGLPEGAYSVQGDKGDGFARTRSVTVEDVRAGTTTLRLALSAGLCARFRLFRVEDRSVVKATAVNASVSSATAAVTISGRGWSTSEATLSEVLYPFENPGTYAADVKVEGYEPVHVDAIEIVADGETVVDVLLKAAPKPE